MPFGTNRNKEEDSKIVLSVDRAISRRAKIILY